MLYLVFDSLFFVKVISKSTVFSTVEKQMKFIFNLV